MIPQQLYDGIDSEDNNKEPPLIILDSDHSCEMDENILATSSTNETTKMDNENDVTTSTANDEEPIDTNLKNEHDNENENENTNEKISVSKTILQDETKKIDEINEQNEQSNNKIVENTITTTTNSIKITKPKKDNCSIGNNKKI
jgi:hypothetical protein